MLDLQGQGERRFRAILQGEGKERSDRGEQTEATCQIRARDQPPREGSLKKDG